MAEKQFQIAVIDDEKKITKLLKLVLQDNFSCEVEIFNDPIEALQRLQEKTFDVISLDHRMPKLTGMDLVKLLRTSKCPNQYTRILLLTGFRDEAECSQINLLEDVTFLEKPVDEARYLRWINVLLNSKKSQAA